MLFQPKLHPSQCSKGYVIVSQIVFKCFSRIGMGERGGKCEGKRSSSASEPSLPLSSLRSMLLLHGV